MSEQLGPDNWRCDHCGKPEAFNVLCPECEALVCLECGRVECCCEEQDFAAAGRKSGQ